MDSFHCPRCGGLLFHDRTEELPDLGWFECCECGSIYDYEDIDLSDEDAA